MKGEADIDAPGLLGAVVRLVRLIETPDEARVLASIVTRQIVYRVLKGGQGVRLSHLLSPAEDTQRISKAIGHRRDHFREPLKIENIARELGMSVSGFHHHFKSVTAMSPLQYQKQIRLQEARRLMLGEDMDAARAPHSVLGMRIRLTSAASTKSNSGLGRSATSRDCAVELSLRSFRMLFRRRSLRSFLHGLYSRFLLSFRQFLNQRRDNACEKAGKRDGYTNRRGAKPVDNT